MADPKKAGLQKLDVAKLTATSVEDLRRELHARQAKPSEDLSQLEDPILVKEVKERQKVIYGTDDRQEVFQLTQPAELADVDSVVALFRDSDVVDNGDGTSTLRTENFGTALNLCSTERFRDQPIGAFCSGFLVAPDIIATAGHCATAGDVTTIRFVFGFRMANASNAVTVINNTEIYAGVAIVGRQLTAGGPDWALVRLDRPVSNHRIAPIRRTGRIADTQAVHVIGHPVGLPTKFAGGAAVRNNTPAAFFVANLDTYGGNSGSPVFNSNTHQVEGILVRGETDFVAQGNCQVSLVCPTTGCRGEDVTRTTEFANLVPNRTIGVKKTLDDEPRFKKHSDDLLTRPPILVKRIRDANMFKKLRDDVPSKGFRDPLPPPPFGGGGLPFSLAVGHHAPFQNGDAQGGEIVRAQLASIQQQWLDLQAALTQARAAGAQAEADAARLEEASQMLASTYEQLLSQLGGEDGGGQ